MKKYFSFFHDLGVDIVCLLFLKKQLHASYKIDKVMDSTGAGDAFWSDYLRTSKIKSIKECV
jgi:fructokinase